MNDKFKYILELQEQGLTRHEIKDKLGYKELDSLTKFLKKRGYSFNKKLNKYTTIDGDAICMTKVGVEIKDNKSQEIVLDDKSMTLDIQQDLKANIVSLAENYDKIQNVLKWFENREYDKSTTQVIEVINEGIKINLPESDIIRTTIRVNKETWDRFDKFAKDNKEFNKQDLIAQALEDYMSKYK